MLFVFPLVLAFASASPARAVTITVTTTTDELNVDGDCSLREAVQSANTNAAVDACSAGSDAATDEIVLAAGTFTLAGAANEDFGESGDLDVLPNTAGLDLIVTGAGPTATIVQACAVSQKLAPCPAGQGSADRVFNVRGAAVTFRHLTMRHGYAGTGGAVYGISASNPGPITIEDCVVTDNHVAGDGGAIRSFYDVVVIDSTVSDNSAQTRGGGIFNESAFLDVRGSTFSGNFAVNAGGAIINSSNGAATIVNSTFSGNGTDVNGGAIFSFNFLTLLNCTITGNTASLNYPDGNGGGLYVGTAATVQNTIIAGNVDLSTTGKVPDCYGPLSAPAYNLVGDGTSCAGITNGANGNQVGTAAAPIDAKLGALADHGGTTLTYEPAADSPAVGGGSPALPGGPAPACATTDQRGVARPQGAVCDIGAVETTDTAAALALDAVQPSTGGNAGTVSAVLHGSGFADGATVTLTRTGAASIPGSATTRAGTGALLTTFDLAGATPGTWNVVVTNPDTTTATLADAFTVTAGGAPVLWADPVMRRQFRRGRLTTVQVVYGNRGTVDAYGVPLWISFPDAFLFALRFVVNGPPVHAGQPATDWTRVGLKTIATDGDHRSALPFVIPVVPAGFTGVLTLRLRIPPTFALGPFQLSFDIGDPFFGPSLNSEVVATFVTQAKQRATSTLHATSLPADATIAAYVTDQLEAIRDLAVETWRNDLGQAPVYSATHLLIDASQFAAAAGGNGFAAASADPDRLQGPLATVGDWLLRVVVGETAQARLIDADCYSPPYYGECPEPDCVGFPEEGECEPGDYPPCSEARPFAPCNPDNPGPTYPPPEDVDSTDPNDKVGPGGIQGIIDGNQPLPYVVFFENVATATAPAQEVVVTDQLDATTLDLATFALGPIAFGDTLVTPPPGSGTFATDVDLRPAKDLLVRIEAGLDDGTGIVTWRFTSLDPATGELPEDPQAGFLPPNATPPEGDGSVLFTVAAKPALALGTEICNQARIVFDLNAPIDTPEWCNTIGVPLRPEDCENCADDDGDGTVDRADEDCAAPADGGGAGVAPDAAKPAAKCGKALRKVGAKLASTRAAQIGKCVKAAADCTQLKPGDAACVTKAAATCGKAFAAIGTATTGLLAALSDQCGPAASALGPVAGFGFDADVAACAARGVPDADTLAEIVDCIGRREACVVDRVIAAAVPRAAELLALAGRAPATDLPCLAASTSGSGAAPPALRKPLRKCDGAVQKATAKLVAARTALRTACAGAVAACVQEKPGDAGCLPKARKTCAAGTAKLGGLDAALAAAVTKSCGAPLVMADLLAPSGLAASALAPPCARLGVAALATPADLATCLAREAACRADQAGAAVVPRLREYLTLGGAAP